MNDDLIIQRVLEAIRRRGLRPPRERFEDMVRRGVIDKNGKILLGMRLPPGVELDDEEPPPEADPPVDPPTL